MARNRQRAKARKQKLHRENIPGALDHVSGEVEEVEAAIVAGAGGEPADADDEAAGEPGDALERDAPAGADGATESADANEPVGEAEPDAGGDSVDVGEPDDDAEPDAEPAPELAPASKRSRRRRARQPAVAVEPDPEPVEPDADADDNGHPDEPYAEDSDAAAVEEGRLGKGAGDLAVAPAARKPSAFRVLTFFRACWAELQRVDWPDRRQVGQATAVVLGFVVVAGAFLGLADVVAQRVVDFIL